MDDGALRVSPQVLGVFGLLLPLNRSILDRIPISGCIHFVFTVDATVDEVLFLLGLLIMAPGGDDHCPISAALQSSERHHRYMRYFANERCEVGKDVGFEPDALDREMLRRFFQVPLPCILLGSTAYVLNHANF
jgi:hypothetical protein